MLPLSLPSELQLDGHSLTSRGFPAQHKRMPEHLKVGGLGPQEAVELGDWTPPPLYWQQSRLWILTKWSA